MGVEITRGCLAAADSTSIMPAHILTSPSCTLHNPALGRSYNDYLVLIADARVALLLAAATDDILVGGFAFYINYFDLYFSY